MKVLKELFYAVIGIALAGGVFYALVSLGWIK